MKILTLKSGLLIALSLSLMVSGCQRVETAPRDFNRDWQFIKGLQPAEVVEMDYHVDDWQAVRLPHDWAIAGPFNPDEHGFAGKLPWKGVGWYRKVFTLPTTDAGQCVYLDFDGVMAFPEVYINGQLAGQWDYGYVSFRVNATKFVKFGQENVVAVKVDTTNQGTRWYPGAGIYRKVTMTVCEPVHLAHWGTHITTPQIGDSLASVSVRSAIENHFKDNADVKVKIILRDPKGTVVSNAVRQLSVPAGESAEFEQIFGVENPQRWDILSPELYSAEITVLADGKKTDNEKVHFGIRTFEFTANDGFHLNGRRVQLYGVNLHHDQGPLGAAFNTRAMQRQLEIMQDMGVNAIRTSHNPPAPELLDLCDRMGLVVWDECFDKWDDKAGRVDGQPLLEEYGEKQIRNFVLRDRNHPSIVVWSIGNEILNQPWDKEGKSPERVNYMRDFVLKYDTSRPVTMACHIPETANEPILDALDLAGWNYARRYSIYREKYPDKPIIYSESASAVSTRGFYELPFPTTKTDYSKELQVSSYDLNAAPWADLADVEFQLMADDDFVAGEFVWTGFDYLGEPTPFDQQARSSYFGIVDLCGIPKDRYYLYRSHWRPDMTTVHILPHWNWPERVGENVPVFVYTNGDSAELFLNGQSLGRRSKGVVPEKSENFAIDKLTTASSRQNDKEKPAGYAVDGDTKTGWLAAENSTGQWLQVDLGQSRQISCIGILFPTEAKKIGYDIEVSRDGEDWSRVVSQDTSDRPNWGGPKEAFHTAQQEGRYVRIVFTKLKADTRPGIQELGIYPEKIESDYYDPTYTYRLRWNDVIYEPGELKVVAYQDGKEIGRAVMRTAGEPARLRLTPDRTELATTGEDLSYLLVEALDSEGNLCPLADNMVDFKIDGPAEVAGVGNGNPMSFEPFGADYRKLFYGKAMLILRAKEGPGGTIKVTASAEGLEPDSAVVRSSDSFSW